MNHQKSFQPQYEYSVDLKRLYDRIFGSWQNERELYGMFPAIITHMDDISDLEAALNVITNHAAQIRELRTPRKRSRAD